MSAILCLDTTASRLMIGVGGDGVVRGRYTAQTNSHRYHSALLVPAIQQVLDEAGVTAQELTALAVNHGPGSFTGIRTGISTIRTMAQFLELPVHVFNSFELLASNDQAPVTIALDALRGRIYRATLHFEASGSVYSEAPALETLAPSESPDIQATRLMVSPTLMETFTSTSERQGIPLSPIPEQPDTPSDMLSLIARYGAAFARPWQEVKPLYLQEPSITLRKK